MLTRQGIGNTPFVSVLRSLAIRTLTNTESAPEEVQETEEEYVERNRYANARDVFGKNVKTEKMYFYTVCQDEDGLAWYASVLSCNVDPSLRMTLRSPLRPTKQLPLRKNLSHPRRSVQRRAREVLPP
jgi:hypothetical protein